MSEQVVWRKSSRSGSQGQCVEVAFTGDAILMRNSKHPEGPVLRFTRAEWLAFLGGEEDSSGARGGEFDL
ncbi:MAG TPA: DUF397 domain-containing protein [Micromonosporaceae bacterium]|jgi:hypothetical protein